MKRLFKHFYKSVFICSGIIQIVNAWFSSCNYTNDYNSIAREILYICHINADTLKYNNANHLQGKNDSHVQGYNQTGIYNSVVFNDVGKQFPNLIGLKIEQSNIKIIEKTDFNDLRNLTYLSLTNDKIHVIKSGAFEKLALLKTLDLSNNVIEDLALDLFENLRELQTLTLNKNWLTSLTTGLFLNNGVLQSVYIKNNNLNCIPSDVFDNLPSLKIIDLENNDCISLKKHELFIERAWFGPLRLLHFSDVPMIGFKSEIEEHCGCNKSFSDEISSNTTNVIPKDRALNHWIFNTFFGIWRT